MSSNNTEVTTPLRSFDPEDSPQTLAPQPKPEDSTPLSEQLTTWLYNHSQIIFKIILTLLIALLGTYFFFIFGIAFGWITNDSIVSAFQSFVSGSLVFFLWVLGLSVAAAIMYALVVLVMWVWVDDQQWLDEGSYMFVFGVLLCACCIATFFIIIQAMISGLIGEGDKKGSDH